VTREPGGGKLAEATRQTRQLSQGDVLTQALSCYCAPQGLAALAQADPKVVLRSAVRALGLRGGNEHISLLARLLRHHDPEVVEAAEDALWRIWLHGGTQEGNTQLAHAVGLIDASRLEQALDVLDRLVTREPTFGEAHHQRGIALFLLERLDEAVDAFGEALEHNCYHFSAAASLGHTYLQQGHFRLALHHYQNAVSLYPTMPGMAESVERLQDLIGVG
jgi:tetratricopeptide (TPR) repeat protein